MKIIFKSLVVIGLVIGISNYFIYLKTGRMPVKEWVQNISWSFDVDTEELAAEAKRMGKGALDKVSPSSAAAPVKVYKWTDANGVVHYGERPAGEGAQELTIDPDNNVLPTTDTMDAPARDNSRNDGDQQAPLEKAKAAAEAMRVRAEAQEGY